MKASVRPPDDELETWHVHGDREMTWDWGVSCDDCRPDISWYKQGPLHDLRYGSMFEERHGQTVGEFKQEMFAEARRTGEDITKA